MKQVLGWWFPDHEAHLPMWMADRKNTQVLNGRQAYQGKKQLAALAHVKQHRVAVDVGSHVGLWSYNLAHVFGTVLAFEPVAEHRACFEKNMLGVGQYVHLHAMALGATEGNVAMHTETGSSGNTTVTGAGDIPLRTLDNFDLEVVDFMKLDCEGYEENVLRGAEATIARCKPSCIVVEQKRDHAARMGLKTLGAVTFLQSLGYVTAEEISGDYIMVPK
jgi:FkbM family methyltransferase